MTRRPRTTPAVDLRRGHRPLDPGREAVHVRDRFHTGDRRPHGRGPTPSWSRCSRSRPGCWPTGGAGVASSPSATSAPCSASWWARSAPTRPPTSPPPCCWASTSPCRAARARLDRVRHRPRGDGLRPGCSTPCSAGCRCCPARRWCWGPWPGACSGRPRSVPPTSPPRRSSSPPPPSSRASVSPGCTARPAPRRCASTSPPPSGTLRSQPQIAPIVGLLVLTALLSQAVFEFGPLWLVEAEAGTVAHGPAWAGLMS